MTEIQTFFKSLHGFTTEQPKPRRRKKSHRTDPAVVEAVARRARGLCEVHLPGCSGVMEAPHHRLIRKQGGPDTLANLLAVCHNCHTLSPVAIHRNIAKSKAAGLLVDPWSDEAAALKAGEAE